MATNNAINSPLPTSLAQGGTNANLTASNGGIFYSTASAAAILAGTATADQVLLSGSSTTPAWSTATYPASTTANQILYSSATNTITGLATANNGVLITDGSGVPSIATATVGVGGTGNTTFTAYSVLCAGTTATGIFQNISGVGSTGQVLTSNGASALPTWQAAGGGGSVTSVSGTANQIDVATGTTTPVISIDAAYVGQTSITTLGTIATGTWNATSIALAQGGTNANLTASNGGIFYSTASAGAILAGTATAGQILRSGASTAPTWSTATYPAFSTVHQILYSSATNTITGLATADNGVLLTNGSGVPSIGTATVAVGGTGNTTFTAYSVICAGTTATGAFQNVSGVGTTGQVLTSNGASALPTWQTGGGSGTVTSITAGSNLTGGTITTSGTIALTSSPSVSGSVTVGTSLNLPSTSSSTVGVLTIGNSPYLHNGNGTGGNDNLFVGNSAGNFTLTGGSNTGLSRNACNALTSGTGNVGIGGNALGSITTGNFNVSIGNNSGTNYTSSESSNICIGDQVNGTAAESNVLRIGNGTGTSSGNINAAYISGITGITVSGTAVLVSSGNQLGIAVSSRRFKENIEDMESESDALLKLRPVTFTFTKDVGGATDERQFGLIAEEVAEVLPAMVNFHEDGSPFSVKYQDMAALIINELQKINQRVSTLERRSA